MAIAFLNALRPMFKQKVEPPAEVFVDPEELEHLSANIPARDDEAFIIRNFFQNLSFAVGLEDRVERSEASGKVKTSAPLISLPAPHGEVVEGIVREFFEEGNWSGQSSMADVWNKCIPAEIKKLQFNGPEKRDTPAAIYRNARGALAHAHGQTMHNMDNVVELHPEQDQNPGASRQVAPPLAAEPSS